MLFRGSARCEGHPQKEYADRYGRNVDTLARKLIGTVTEFVTHCYLVEVAVGEVELGSEKRIEVVMKMLRTATNV